MIIRILFFAVALLLALPIAIGYMLAYSVTHNTCVSPSPKPVGYGMVAEEISFPSGELTIPAYFIPGETDGTVIIAPPLNHDHNGQLDYAAMFNELGLNVLVMGSRVCIGEFSTLGYDEGDDVNAAYAYLTTRDDVNPERVSVHGFSAGGAAALFGAARTPALRAVSAMGNYHDFEASMGGEDPNQTFVTWLILAGVRIGYHMSTGKPISLLKATDAVEAINPRPMLFVYGTLEPELDGIELNARAENGILWFVEGVGHGGYLQAYPEEGREIIGGFHVEALLGENE